MPEAIATTKRKFYKVLDSLNNVPSTPSHTASTPSIKPPSEPVAKRVRRDISSTTTIGQPLQVTYLPLSSDPKAYTVNGFPTVNKEPTPNFSPWSHDAFLIRLKTFSSVSQWHPKPESIGEVAWAKRGWVCVGVNTVGCRGGCEKRVVIDLGPRTTASSNEDETDAVEDEDDVIDGPEFEASLVRRYEVLIVSGHATGCLWRRSGCQDDIYHVQVVRPAIWQPALSARYTSLLKVERAVRNVTFRGISTSELASSGSTPATMSPEQLLTYLPESLIPTSPDDSLETRQKVLEISLHGWHGSIESGNELLFCTTCFQRVGLWMYQPGYKSVHRVADDEMEGEQEQGADIVVVDLLEMHREHCPWRNGHSQKASGSLQDLNATQILQRVVATFAREQRRRTDERNRVAIGDIREQNETDDENDAASRAPVSKEEVARQDKERESRLRRLKNLFSIKRRSTVKAPTGTGRPTSVASRLSSTTTK